VTRRVSPDEMERRLNAVRRELASRHAGIEPDAAFAARVVARLPRSDGWSIDWAARRVLPISIALALVLVIAVVATGRPTGSETNSTSLTAATSSPARSQSSSDPLEWLLEGREEVQ
jgi:hypothetical protein